MLNLLMNFKSLLLLTSLILFIGCETIKNKTDEIAKKENEFLSNFIGKESSELKSNLGIPTEDFIGGTGQNILIYKTKKYGIPCERRFEVNKSGIVTGFISNGCF